MKLLSYEEIGSELEKYSQKYRDFIEVCREGTSEKGRWIYSFAVGKGKKTLICTGGVHGRESINPTVLVKMANRYGAQSDEKLLQEYRILFIPLLNPDGYEMARLDSQKKDWKYNAYGVDINRDFLCQSYRKQKSSRQPFSSRESRILARVFERENSIGYLDFHSRGKEIYWYRGALDSAYNKRQKEIAGILCKKTGYRLGTMGDEAKDNLSGGNTVQYYSETYHMPALTIETVWQDEQFPLNSSWILDTYEEIKETPILYLGWFCDFSMKIGIEGAIE